MGSKEDISGPNVPGQSSGGDGSLSDNQTDRMVKEIQLPEVKDLLSESTVSFPPAPAAEDPQLEPLDGQKMFKSLQAILDESEKEEGSFAVGELRVALEEADEDARHGTRDPRTLSSVKATVEKLWQSRSEYMAPAVEALANASRDPSWRAPFGESGLLDFFLRIIASTEEVDDEILLHSLRLAGNSCADTNENRQIVVDGNYTLAILRLFLKPSLVQIAIPVIYNICTDFEPAQSQVAHNRVAYILLKLIKDGSIRGNALLNYAYELIEMAAEQASGIERSPDGTILLLMEIALEKETTFAQFCSLVNSLATYLQNERFQRVCVQHGLVETMLTILRHSYDLEIDESSSEDVGALAQLRLKVNQALSDLSALPEFGELYPLGSPFSKVLESYLDTNEDQLQICSCVMLGNLARSDEVCSRMVREFRIHERLISILKSDAVGAVLHAAIGFLKNLAIASENRPFLASAGLIPAVSRLWAFETVPQIQFSAVSLVRQVTVSSVENVSQLLERLSADPDSPAHNKTYLSLLLSLFGRTDSAPIKTEIGRTIASLCRTINSKTRESSEEINTLFERLFDLHPDVARPLGAMITQKEWPVVRSEGWFAIALMASSKEGSVAVVDCLQNMDVYKLLEETLSSDIPDSLDEKEKQKRSKDRDNTIILVQELLKHDPQTLPPPQKAMLEDFAKDIKISPSS
ncbi:hypothetical protein DTO271D3_2066 [Paecilomyces variotii]|nr:hypothetical protein DTO271D3_2066 [Paecilomyces variotii]